MIRIISLSLLTLMLSCANTRPESAEETSQQDTPAVTASAAPVADSATALRSPQTAEQKTTSGDNKRVAKPASQRKRAAKSPAVTAPAVAPQQPSTTTAAVCIPAISTTEAHEADEPQCAQADSTAAAISDAPQTHIAAATHSVQTTSSATTASSTAQFAPSVLEVPSLSASEKQAHKKHFLPTRRRIDREINKLKFAYKGEVMMGLTASYGTLSSDDTDFMLILDNINASGTIASVKPFMGYFYRDNSCLGVRFGYNHVSGTVNSTTFDLGASNDTSFDVPFFNTVSDSYSFGIFHRSYAGLDPKGRFGLFAEFELSVSTGSSEFTYESGDVHKSTFSDNTQAKLSFNPGAAVYIFPNVCATLSFGLGGLQYTSVTQKDAQGNKIGTRKSSNMKFKLNIAAINIGMTIHLWDKKKQ